MSLPLAFYYCDSLIFNVTERGCLKDYYITRLVIFLIFKENLAITLWNQCRFFSASTFLLKSPVTCFCGCGKAARLSHYCVSVSAFLSTIDMISTPAKVFSSSLILPVISHLLWSIQATALWTFP